MRHEIGTRGNTGHCLESHDLAASKLFAYREKDRDFVRTMLVEKLIDADVLCARIDALPTDPETQTRLKNWVRRTEAEL